MMRVSKITADGDWSFGKGRANYVTNTDAVRQNVVTRIRSFTNDWYADINHGIFHFADKRLSAGKIGVLLIV